MEGDALTTELAEYIGRTLAAWATTYDVMRGLGFAHDEADEAGAQAIRREIKVIVREGRTRQLRQAWGPGGEGLP